MRLRDKIEIEPLGEGRLSKIRRSVFERLDEQDVVEMARLGSPRAPRPALWVRAGRVALAVVAAAALVVAGASRLSGPHRPVAGANPSRVVTGSTESHLVLGDNAIDVSPNSALLTSGEDEQGLLLVLERGSVSCDVAPRRGRPPFVVQAGSVRVRVVGTHFTVTRVEDSARVDVAHGTVEVSSSGHTFVVADGATWPPSTASAGLNVPPVTAGTTSMPPTVPVWDLPAAKKQGTERIAPRAQSLPSASDSSAPSSLPSPPISDAPVEEPGPQHLFEEAAASEKRDPAHAASIYRRLTTTAGPWAANALFAQGRLEADLGNVNARETLHAYLARYPQGRNAADARALLERLK